MKKIGILTYHNAINYGAVFQAFALQQYLLDMGHDAYIIDYKNPSIEEQYQMKPLGIHGSIMTSIKWDIKQSVFLPAKKKSFREWERKFRLLPVTDKDNLREIANNLDKVIVGSDQVWKLKAHDYDPSYFLDFAKEDRRISYAASFGASTLNDSEKEFISRYLKGIPFISVREKSGVELVEKLIGRKAEHVLDPVLLMDKEFWISNMSEEKMNQSENYIFVYQLGTGNYIPEFAHQLADEMKLKVIYVSDNLLTMLKYHFSAKNRSSIGPSGFLNLLYGARLVCTNSFHATALSLILHKDFYTVINGNENDLWNTRMYSLLKNFDFESRIVHVGDTLKKYCSCEFDSISERLTEYRRVSRSFLEKSIAGDEYETNNIER